MKSPADRNRNETFIGCTIAPAASAPKALVLAKSFLEFHPDARFAILFIDQPDYTVAVPNLILLGLTDLALGPGEEWRLPMLFRAREMMALLKPRLLQVLLRTGAKVAAYFEYSSLVLGPISDPELTDQADSVVASPRIENDFGDCGRSFIAVSQGAERHLTDWFDQSWNGNVVKGSPAPGEDRLEALEGVFDRVPHSVITTPTWALCYANLNPNAFQSAANGYQVDGKPIRSFDFRGYDPDKPYLLSKYQGLEPRILLSEVPALTKLCDDYRARIVEAGAGRPGSKRDANSLPGGLPLNHRILKLYRDALDRFRAGEGVEPRSPFEPEGEQGFVDWLNEPLGEPKNGITRYILAIHNEREDVQNAFPDPLGADALGFRGWFLNYGRHELNVPDIFVPGATSTRDSVPGEAIDSSECAVNVAGFFRAELGIGGAARSLLSALEAAGIPFNTISFCTTASRQDNPFVDRRDNSAQADLNIACINPDLFSSFAKETGRELFHGRYTIGVWFWEVEDFPKSLHGAFDYVDELWVASQFMHETFLKVSPKPVFKYRLPIVTPQVDPSLSRRDLGLPERFTFLFSFDLFSVLERKNPIGLIRAFTRAFPDCDGPVLVIKTINGDKRCLEMEKLKYAVRGRSDIILREGYLSEIENNTMTALADCYVSLHRSEGFGLTIAEAMALGKPVIATAYSGNMEFMTPENSYPCPFVRAEVGSEREPYPADSHWSDPDAEAAAQLLRYVYLHQEEARSRGLRAAEDIRVRHSPQAAAPIIAERIATIRRRRATARPFRSIGFLEDRLEMLEASLRRTGEDTSNA
jgi:glycosyltransferase involved in cell wall biosynthesis